MLGKACIQSFDSRPTGLNPIQEGMHTFRHYLQRYDFATKFAVKRMKK